MCACAKEGGGGAGHRTHFQKRKWVLKNNIFFMRIYGLVNNIFKLYGITINIISIDIETEKGRLRRARQNWLRTSDFRESPTSGRSFYFETID